MDEDGEFMFSVVVFDRGPIEYVNLAEANRLAKLGWMVTPYYQPWCGTPIMLN